MAGPGMTLDELKEALIAADPAAVLIPGHLLARSSAR